jgi:hypothetical protein
MPIRPNQHQLIYSQCYHLLQIKIVKQPKILVITVKQFTVSLKRPLGHPVYLKILNCGSNLWYMQIITFWNGMPCIPVDVSEESSAPIFRVERKRSSNHQEQTPKQFRFLFFLSTSYWLLSCHTFWYWRWRLYVSPKHWWTITGLQGVT